MTRLSKRPTLLSAAPLPQNRSARKPRLMIAGEFSAGKTRLINGLIGEDILPSNVTATALPPVWLVQGAPACYAVAPDGIAQRISAPDEADLAQAQAQFCILSHPAPVLARFDIIDTPGTSDPNMPAESWERMLPFADTLLWCSNATQAWRQSEKSVWTEMPERLARGATLLITHADRMPDARAAERVLRRVRRDAAGCFNAMLMESLLDPAALTRIRDHLMATLGGMTDPSGADCPVMDDLPQSARSPSDPPSEAPTDAAPIAPRRVRREVKATDAIRGEAPCPARALWQKMSRDADLTQAQGILRCLDRFLTALDSPKSDRATPKPQSNDPDPADALIQRLMSRRTP